MFQDTHHSKGALTTLEKAAQVLVRRWVPKWYEVFANPHNHLFYERVGQRFEPLETGQTRLLAQLRQLSMYAHALTQPETFLFSPHLGAHMAAITKQFKQGALWAYASDDARADLYTQAFVIFACAHYARASHAPEARLLALEAAEAIHKDFRLPSGGFAESLPDTGALRRHESHMHLLEACLTASSLWDDALFKNMADEIVQLFHTKFYDSHNNILSEYFTAHLTPAPDAQTGKITCEPGHYFEWIWLLKKHGNSHDATCVKLLEWANTHGWDNTYGGIYDELEPDGTIISDKKRIWPLTEGLKANALLLNATPDRDFIKARLRSMAHMLENTYIEKRGFWSEWLNRDLTPMADYMPATTPYHVYFGIMEARDILRARGVSKSWRAGPQKILYSIRRKISTLVRATKYKFK